MTGDTNEPSEILADQSTAEQSKMLAVVTGIVHPTKLGWLIERPVDFILDGELDGRVFIRQSQFNVFLYGDRPNDLATLLNQVEDITQACLDSLGFHLATPLRAETLSMIIDGRELVHKDGRWPALLPDAENPEYYVPAQKLAPFIDAAIREPLVRLALADLRTAIDSPGDTVMLCFRAIESVRQWFLRDGELDVGAARKRSWVDLRATLSIEEDEIRALENLAISRRHGAGPLVPEKDRLDALRLTRRIVEDFIAHQLSNPRDRANATVLQEPTDPI